MGVELRLILQKLLEQYLMFTTGKRAHMYVDICMGSSGVIQESRYNKTGPEGTDWRWPSC